MSSRQTPDRRGQPTHTLQQVLTTQPGGIQDALDPYTLNKIWNTNPSSCLDASKFRLTWTKMRSTMDITMELDPEVAMAAIVSIKTAIIDKLAALWPQARPLQEDKEYAYGTQWKVRTADATMVTTEQFITWADAVTQEFIAENKYVSLQRTRTDNTMLGRNLDMSDSIAFTHVSFVICRKMEVRPNLLLSSNYRKYFATLNPTP